ncbi:hypothetical protein [Puniceicoccus vermicola]|uniref:Uncharacterized protein n=1 Tax=Puniceicoccus vermicola TaxID=388746 RepID=A0A7X1B2G0_9BACT|nr:hypothetical protein [Puniceicoccus vermicola]MBC2603343.1 hypothetical protein [Puniceicoccus vermicola]
MNTSPSLPTHHTARQRALHLLHEWSKSAENDWSTLPNHPSLGVYGTGYDGWGTQTQQKYAGALATLAVFGTEIPGCDPDWARERALAALRFNLASHKSGQLSCTDGDQWGLTWISALGTERMMFAWHLLKPWLSDEDQSSMRGVLCSEADWILNSYHRGGRKGIWAEKWASEGNDPESNLWNGAHLWRAAAMYPDHPDAGAWQEKAHRFLINGVSVEADANDESIIAGKPIRERHLGANFFPHYALDHHGYLNVGYMVICMSNAAMLHFDLKAEGLPAPESLHHHQRDLWQVLRKMIFSNGRLARIGGDTRVRYGYCQEYLLPSLLYAADQLGEPFGLDLVNHQLAFIEKETRYNADGAFYSRRLADLRKQSPLYYTRLESDRASALAMLATHLDSTKFPEAPGSKNFEQSVAGSWIEPEHGAAIHRSPTRFASFSWRAFELGQGLCLPPSDGHRAEWEYNLGGRVEFCHHPHPHHFGPAKPHREIDRYHLEEFPGGFYTCGTIVEGTHINLAESWCGTDSARLQTAFAALPDDHTVVGLHFAQMGDRRGYVASIKGLHLNLPNDLYQDHQLALTTASGKISLRSPAHKDEDVNLQSHWAQLPGKIGVVGLYGASSLSLQRSASRNAGIMKTLQTEILSYPLMEGPLRYEAGETILDSGWTLISGKSSEETRKLAENRLAQAVECPIPDWRVVRILGQNALTYLFMANFGSGAGTLSLENILSPGENAEDLKTELPVTEVALLPSTARLLAIH